MAGTPDPKGLKNYGLDDRYTVVLHSPDRNFTIMSPIPENFGIAINSTWEPRLAELISAGLGSAANTVRNINGAAGQLVNLISNFKDFAAIKGAGVLPKALSALSWMGSSPLQFQIPFYFDAVESAYEDVVKPIVQLLMMAAPSEGDVFDVGKGVLATATDFINSSASYIATGSTKGGGFLRPPGPNALAKDGGETIRLSIGRFAYFESVIITGVNATFESRMDAFGMPVSGTCDVTISTQTTPTNTDIGGWFGIDNAGEASNSNTIASALQQYIGAGSQVGAGSGATFESVLRSVPGQVVNSIGSSLAKNLFGGLKL